MPNRTFPFYLRGPTCLALGDGYEVLYQDGVVALRTFTGAFWAGPGDRFPRTEITESVCDATGACE